MSGKIVWIDKYLSQIFITINNCNINKMKRELCLAAKDRRSTTGDVIYTIRHIA